MTHRIKYPLARLSPAKQELLVVAFPYDDVMAGDVAPLSETLSALVSSKETAEQFEGRLTFYFPGWDEDSRETAEIPEIRRWFGDLTARFPYWLHFVEKEGDTLFHVMRLLCDFQYVRLEPGKVGGHFTDWEQVRLALETLFGYQNQLCQRLALPEEMNERIAEEVAQLFECIFQ